MPPISARRCDALYFPCEDYNELLTRAPHVLQPRRLTARIGAGR